MFVPGLGKALDNKGVLVTTSMFSRFQEELQANFPFLQLAMDREDELWCIVRRDPYRRRAWLGWEAGHLAYSADVYTPVLYLEYPKALPDGSTARVFMRPGPWVFRVLREMHPEHLGFDNCKRTWREHYLKDLARRRRQKLQMNQRIDDGVKDWARHVDLSDPYRFKTSILVSKP